MTAEIIPAPTVNLRNIPERLRWLADQIESGEEEACAIFVVIPRCDENPKLYGWGDIDGTNNPIIQMALCHHWLLNNVVGR